MDQPITWLDLVLDPTQLLPYLNQLSDKSEALSLLELFIDKVPATNDYSRSSEGGLDESSPARVHTQSDRSGGDILKKSLTLKSLAFKTAAYLQWDLNLLSKMSIDSQFLLVTYVNDAFGDSNIFCRCLYYRWMLNAEGLEKFDPVVAVARTAAPLIFEKLKTLSLGIHDYISVPTFDSIKVDATIDTSHNQHFPIWDFLPCLNYTLGVFALRSAQILDHVALFYFRLLQTSPLPTHVSFAVNPQTVLGYLKLLGASPPTEDEVTNGQKLNVPPSSSKCYEEQILKVAHPTPDLTFPVLTPLQSYDMSLSDVRFALIDGLLRSSDPKEIGDLIGHIDRHPEAGKRSILTYYPVDAVPAVIKSSIAVMDAGPAHDTVFALVANGLRLLKIKQFSGFRTCLTGALSAVRIYLTDLRKSNCRGLDKHPRKLEMLIGWELLLGDLEEAFENWNTPSVLAGLEGLIDRCEKTIRNFQAPQTIVRPRSDVVEASLMLLLNCEKFELVINLSKYRQGWPFLEFLTMLGRVGINVLNRNYFASNFRDMWNSILPLLRLTTVNMVKRNSGLVSESVLANGSALTWVLNRAKSSNMVKIFVSIFVKLLSFAVQPHLDEMQIQVELMEQWPNFLDEVSDSRNRRGSGPTLRTVTTLNISLIREMLVKLLHSQRCSGDVPEELKALRILGQVHLGHNPFLAMTSCVEYIAQTTHFFEPDALFLFKDDEVVRRMIKGSHLLHNFLQAAILCQFLTCPDYVTAFGMLSEPQFSTEAWAGLFEFIWDLSILEYIVKHYSQHRTFNKERRDLAIRLISQFELSDHNTDEMKRAAIRPRKVHFMRTLANIYLVEI